MKSLIFISALLALSPQDEPAPPASRQVGEHSGTIARPAGKMYWADCGNGSIGRANRWAG